MLFVFTLLCIRSLGLIFVSLQVCTLKPQSYLPTLQTLVTTISLSVFTSLAFLESVYKEPLKALPPTRCVITYSA